MSKFLRNIIYFIIPIVVVLMFPLTTLYTTGENFMNIDATIEKDENYIIGFGLHDQNFNYLKWKNITFKPKHDLLSVGSSRVLKFRKEMFNKTFYNAGYTIKSMYDFRPFLKSFSEEKLPDYLILGIDQWMFKKTEKHEIRSTDFWRKSFVKYPRFSILKLVYEGYLDGSLELTYPKSEGVVKVGLNAFKNNKGFRNDGSMNYGNVIKKIIAKDSTLKDFEFKDTYDRIRQGSVQFSYGASMDTAVLRELDSLLFFCQQKKIEVVGFLPPFADAVNQRLKASNNYHYMDSIYDKSMPIFEKYNYEFWDFSELKKVGSGDNEVLDGFHGSEVTYAKMLIYMNNNHSILAHLINIKDLEAKLKNREHSLLIY